MQNNASAIKSKTDYVMVRKNKSMRYVIAEPQSSTQNGTILLLQAYGKHAEDYHTSLLKLVTRGFYVITPDFIGQGKSDKENNNKSIGHISDYRRIIDDLDILLQKVILANLPAPYYILGDDMGAIFALIGHDLFAKKIRRQVLIAPLLTPNRHGHHSLFHNYCRIMSDIGLGRLHTQKPLANYGDSSGHHLNTTQIDTAAITQPTRPPTLGWYATMLDAIEHVFSSSYIDKMTIPTLVYLPSHDNITSSRQTRELVARLRMAQSIDLRGAPHDILSNEDKYSKQFWQGFSAFIPGASYIPNFNLADDWQDQLALTNKSTTYQALLTNNA